MKKIFILLIGGLMAQTASAQMAEMDVQFCGESVPQNQPLVTQRWQRTLSRQAGQSDQLLLLKRRSSVVFPIIEPILEKYGLPQDFKFLPLLESEASGQAISPKGAGGFWQIMPGTARLLGLSTIRHRDERFDLRKSTDAAARYIKSLYDELGSWMLVALAYNAGPNYIKQVVSQNPAQHALTLPLKNETKAYLFQTLALKELLTRPQAYRDYLTEAALASLSEGTVSVTDAERLAILGSFGEGGTDTGDTDSTATFVAPLPVDGRLLLTELADEPNVPAKLGSGGARAEEVIQLVAETTVAPAEPTANTRLETRSLTTGPLTNGQMLTMIVLKNVTINGQPMQIGDLIYAHVELVEPSLGRVFIRTDRLVSARTQETRALSLIAAELPRQPGVPLPAYNQITNNWRLTWESTLN